MYICPMRRKKYLQVDVIVYKKSSSEEVLDPQLAGVIEENAEGREVVVNYAFDASTISEFRESFVNYQGEDHPAVVCVYGETYPLETPAILISVEDFKLKLDEYNNEEGC